MHTALPPIAQLTTELGEMLGADDAQHALSRALARLAELGVTPAAANDTPFISLDVKSRSLTLCGGDAELGAALRPLLRLALLRAVEQEEHTKTSERLQLMSEASFEGILVHIDGVVVDVNQRLAEMLRCKPEDLLGADTVRRTIAPEDQQATLERVAQGYEGAYTITGVRHDGTRFRAELQSKQGRLGDRPVRIAAVRDITEQERTLSLLRQSETYLRDLALGAFDFMVVTNNGVLVDVGGNVQAVTGYTREEMLGKQALDFAGSSGRHTVAAAIAENRLGAYETSAKAKGGGEIPVECVVVPSTLHGDPVRVAGFRDLREARRLQTEAHKLEQQLQKSQRLDSLGVLAGGIAHDFNNLLVGVIGNASMLLATLTNPLERAAAAGVMTAGQRAASLTKQMLAYAGRQDLGSLKPVDMADLFGELQTLLGATLSKKANLRLELAPGSIALGNRAPLTQVMMNLLTNASDALEGKPGKIEVRTRHVEQPDARWATALGAPVGPGHWLSIEVEDDGVGMDEATRQRVFEPFFSTKEYGHGLGLAACLGIVTSHGGALLLESEAGRGSCFSLLLPAATSAAPSDGEAAALARPAEPCRVLVIDDEQLVRAQLRRLLELHGYEVAEACDGLSGVDAHQRAPADVLIVDMTMPDIDGAEVVRRVRATDSRVAIVISSGYQAEAAAKRLEPGSFQAFLPKPYAMGELLHAIERARARTLES